MPWQDHPQSKENAERVGKDACSDYVNAVSKRWVGFATNSGLYIVAEFSNVADGMLADNLFDLPRTIGKDLENSGYTGDLIIKTRWEHPTTPSNSGDFRQYKLIDLQSIVFLYQELQVALELKRKQGFYQYELPLHG